MNKQPFSPKFRARIKETDKLDPIIDFGKHMRSQKNFIKPSGNKLPHTSLRLCTSYSPRVKLAQNFIEGIDTLCDNTRKNIDLTRSSVLSLRYQLGNLKIITDDFEERRNDILAQCQDFVYERKFTLKTQQDFLLTKKLQKSVTKKLIG